MSAAQVRIDDPSDFKAAQLSTLDELLRCPICKEIYKDALIITTCLHSFCALCIRRSLSNEQFCPICRKEAYENSLKFNADIDNIANSWRESRQFLLSMDRMATAHSPVIHHRNDSTDDFMSTDDLKFSTSTSEIPASSSTRRSSRLSSQTAASAASLLRDPLDGNQSNVSDMDDFQSSQLPTSPSSDTNANTITKLTSTSIVECPICCKKMSYTALDVHIDKCNPTNPHSAASGSESSLFQMNSSSSSLSFSSSFSVPMTKASKPHNKSDLNKLLRSFNLPEHGDRAQRIWRHKEYVNLYNANSDSKDPVSAKELVRRLRAAEQSMIAEKHNQSKRKATDPEEHKATYADQYTSLINDIKRQKQNSHDDDTPTNN
ncbi:hypothetical protein [Parasitella parasitica]|uniref:Postreplication repair E3 ubiquitin-protein ligase RAD18 n=1 Tax=Parasitella parasitica TaxID=35722 RepID=A0A0B7N9M2_9FUNG|nr:hypothetical protein [Parasitella parasitica]